MVAAETRLRALSLLVREYEQLRRMVTYVRWFEGDADRFVPSLYAGRGGRRAKDDAPVDDRDEIVVPDASGVPGMPTTNVPGLPNSGSPVVTG